MNLKSMKFASFMAIIVLTLAGCSQPSTAEQAENTKLSTDTTTSEQEVVNQTQDDKQDTQSDEQDTQSDEETAKESNDSDETSNFDTSDYQLVDSSACSLSGERVANAKVDIGYDSDYATRDYYAYTNEYSQLVYVEAEEIILQNDDKEISGDDRYCSDEAKVPGVEESDLDEGHVIADSLGGASNAYNITPQGSQLNRYGTQADIEEDIRSNGGATNFTATIEYQATDTQIPSTYTLSYTVNGTPKSYTFDNEYTPDGSDSSVNTDTTDVQVDTTETTSTSTDGAVSYANCTAVRDAGAAPIYEGDPGYSRSLDRDGDGVGCE